jgi:nickel transport protein
MARYRAILVLVLSLLVSAPLQAHRLKVFATAEGSRIEGTAYFAGGAKAGGAFISVQDAQGRELARLTPDATGAFSYTATQRMDYHLVADTRDGHRASWTVRADELPAALPAPAHDAKASPQGAALQPAPQTTTAMPPAAVDTETVSLVEQAVARQVRPLREELEAYGDRVRLHDILGGFGYIAGIAGLGLWWRSRRQRE